MRANPLIPLLLALALAGTGCRAASDSAEPETPARLALMTTLPIYWPEADGVDTLLAGTATRSQARQTLETRFALDPLDTLEAASLRGHRRLLLAQPRALAPTENVALDAWVRQGGRLLLFADPLLTRHSDFAVGDKRRAQDVVLLSPILSHWGLALGFDPDQPAAPRTVEAAGLTCPVAMAGRFAATPGSGCTVAGEGMLARCTIGRGRVTILADAALLDDPEDGTAAPEAQAALRELAALAFD